MSLTLRARFDGKVFVPEAPVALQPDTLVEFTYAPWPAKETDVPPLRRLYEMVKDLPANPNSPGDAAAQHDHYLYGTPKRENP
jgi:hypothetical protein